MASGIGIERALVIAYYVLADKAAFVLGRRSRLRLATPQFSTSERIKLFPDWLFCTISDFECFAHKKIITNYAKF